MWTIGQINRGKKCFLMGGGVKSLLIEETIFVLVLQRSSHVYGCGMVSSNNVINSYPRRF